MKKEIIEEKYKSVLKEAKEELSSLTKIILKKLNESNDSDETHILLHELSISQPIFREDPHNDEMSETISSIWVDGNGKIGFEVDTFEGGYDIDIDDIDMDMILYLIEQLEDVDVDNL